MLGEHIWPPFAQSNAEEKKLRAQHTYADGNPFSVPEMMLIILPNLYGGIEREGTHSLGSYARYTNTKHHTFGQSMIVIVALIDSNVAVSPSPVPLVHAAVHARR